ncbi:MAG: hypothetical protein KBT32_01700 [Bacteroidales bacterium]|nr:hypothetical protein [Candidatus Physcocola equi]
MKKFKFFLASLLIACLSFGFSSCSKDSDDDNSNSESKSAIVGDWSHNDKLSSIVSVMNGEKVPAEDEFFGNADLVFNADGTFAVLDEKDPINGKYSINGKELTLEYTGKGQKYVVKKGADLSEIMAGNADEDDDEEDGDDSEGSFSLKVEECSAVVNGDQLTITFKYVSEMSFGNIDDEELGGLGGLLDMFSGKTTTTSINVYDRKK